MRIKQSSLQFSSAQWLSRLWLFATPWTAAHQASLTLTNSQSLLKLMSVESVMPSIHLILCCPLLLPASVFPRIRIFSNESFLHIRWPKYWSFSFSISPSNENSGLISIRMDGWISLQSKGLSRVFYNTTVQSINSLIKPWHIVRDSYYYQLLLILTRLVFGGHFIEPLLFLIKKLGSWEVEWLAQGYTNRNII